MHSFVVFSYEDIRGVFGSVDRRRLHEWVKKGYVTPLIKGFFDFLYFGNKHLADVHTKSRTKKPGINTDQHFETP